jgi:putative Mg2+ transporter-C (MgtC) family protein
LPGARLDSDALPFRIMHPELEMLLRVFVAAILGGAVGYDRQKHDKPAGLRTHMLVALGAAAFVASGALALSAVEGDPETTRLDLLRVTAAIATGIGFLGAGAIMRSGATVRGLTTAAGIWVTAGIGVVVGVGQYILAVGTTLITVVIIAILGHPNLPTPGGPTSHQEVPEGDT